MHLPFVPSASAGHLAVVDGRATVVAGAAVATDVRDALQGSLVWDRGAATEWRDPTVAARRVLATTADGRLLVIAGELSGDELAALLGELRATEALLFERAAGGAHWTGDEGVRDAWPESAVFIEGVAAPSQVLRLESWLSGARTGA